MEKIEDVIEWVRCLESGEYFKRVNGWVEINRPLFITEPKFIINCSKLETLLLDRGIVPNVYK